MFAVRDIALEAVPDDKNKIESVINSVAELAGDLISGTIGNCGFNQNLPIEKLVGDVKDVANVFIPEGKAKEISDTAFDGLLLAFSFLTNQRVRGTLCRRDDQNVRRKE